MASGAFCVCLKGRSYLTVQHADVLSPLRDREIEQLLHRQHIRVFHAHHRDVVQAIKVGQGLDRRSSIQGDITTLGLTRQNPGYGNVTSSRLLTLDICNHAFPI